MAPPFGPRKSEITGPGISSAVAPSGVVQASSAVFGQWETWGLTPNDKKSPV